MTNNPFMDDLPYVNPFSGLISDSDGFMNLETGVIEYAGRDTAKEMLFTGTNKDGSGIEIDIDNSGILTKYAGNIAIVLGMHGIMDNQMCIAENIALYHTAQDYCEAIGQSVEGLFPAIARDYRRLGLEDDVAIDAFKAGYQHSISKDAEHFVFSNDDMFVDVFISGFPPAMDEPAQPSEASILLDALRAELGAESDYKEQKRI